MPTACTEQQHLLYYEKNALLDLDVPPKKLLHRSGLTIYVPDDEEQEGEEEEEEEEGEEVDTSSCDEFRMYEFKVRRCMRGWSHDWTDCPFAHPGEKARRRDPRRYHYSGTICPNFRRSGACPREDACEFAHGVFECWLHPARYRTMPCKDGRRCRRKVCFFAHSPRQLRFLPSLASANPTTPIPSLGSPRQPSRCPFLRAASSPTSTLRGFSPPISPLISPSFGPLQPSRFTTAGDNSSTTSITTGSTCEGCGVLFSSGVMGYDSLYEELMCSLEEMELSGATAPTSSGINGNGGRSSSSFSNWSFSSLMEGKDLVEERRSSSGSSCGPDVEWVNELLM